MTYIVDASVAIKWFVAEDLRDPARALLFVSSGNLEAPDFMITEVANIARKKAARDEISDQQALKVPPETRYSIDEFHSSFELTERALEIALTLQHSVYDCVYLACAEAIGGIFVTADQDLCKTARNTPFEDLTCPLDSALLNVLLSQALSLSTIGLILRMAEKERDLQSTLDAPFSKDISQGMPPAETMQMYLQSPTRRALHKLISDLRSDERADLRALMLLGQGEDGNWQTLRETAAKEDANPGFLADDMTGRPLLADYLRQALNVLRLMRWPSSNNAADS